MTKLEKALSKRALETLDQIRFERGFRSRAKTLEVILLEAVLDDETGDSIRLTPGERRVINQRLDEILQGKTVPASEVFAELAARRRNEYIKQSWDRIIPVGYFANSETQKLYLGENIKEPSVFQEKLISLLSELTVLKSQDFYFLNGLFVRGYEPWEIEKYEVKFGFLLPESYREFLGIIGKNPIGQDFSHNNIFDGCICLDAASSTKDEFISADPNDSFPLPPMNEKVVFYYSRDSSIFEYFIADSEDPHVFHYNVLEGSIDLNCTFSERIVFILQRQIDFTLTGFHHLNESKSKYYRVP